MQNAPNHTAKITNVGENDWKAVAAVELHTLRDGNGSIYTSRFPPHLHDPNRNDEQRVNQIAVARKCQPGPERFVRMVVEPSDAIVGFSSWSYVHPVPIGYGAVASSNGTITTSQPTSLSKAFEQDPEFDHVLATEASRQLRSKLAQHFPHTGRWHLGCMVVHPDHQGRGYGKSLMEDGLRFIEQSQYPDTSITLISEDGKQSFYEKHGFKVLEWVEVEKPQQPGAMYRWPLMMRTGAAEAKEKAMKKL